MTAFLTLNAGSSSLKFSIFVQSDRLEQVAEGQGENIGGAARLTVDRADFADREIGAVDHDGAMQAVLDVLRPRLKGRTLAGLGHRNVQGGDKFEQTVRLTPEILSALQKYEPLAPLHQPFTLRGVAAAQTAFAGVPQVACFDTAFHRGHPWVNDTFGLPRHFYEEGVRRYGFHGLSYKYITDTLRRKMPEFAKGRVVLAHLGNGASMCAVRNGESVGSTMGFSALDGLPMGTRCGQIDPGVILYLIRRGYTEAELTRILYRESGLKGLSGLTHDMRTLLASALLEAKQAIDYYLFRCRRELGAMSAVLGGLDAMVFCGGIGENAAPIRAGIISGMEYLGLRLDPVANQESRTHINAAEVPILVIPTDEERVIAEATAALTSAHMPHPLPVHGGQA